MQCEQVPERSRLSSSRIRASISARRHFVADLEAKAKRAIRCAWLAVSGDHIGVDRSGR